MYYVQSEKGAVLLLFVLVLIMGSGAAIVRQGGDARFQGASDAALYLTAEQNLQRLNHAKQALLAAAITYADNYGPRGSGPGHLPCPDLDPPDDGNSGNDGPDPPCGRVENQIGRVPRLTLATRSDVNQSDAAQIDQTDLVSAGAVSTLATEYSELNRTKLLEFYPQLSFQDRQPWYVVDNAFINNPTNRIVNAGTTTTLVDGAGRAVVAVLITPGKEVAIWNQRRPSINPADYIESLASTMSVSTDTTTNTNTQRLIARDHQPNSNDQLVFIYRDELMPLVYRRVASYVTDLLLHKAEDQCPLSVDPAVDAGDEHRVTPATSECLSAMFVKAWNDDERTGVDNSTCQSQVINHDSHHVLGLEHCLELLMEDETLEGVSASRHWLIKNRWPEHITLTINNECVSQVAVTCVLTWSVGLLDEDGNEGIEEGADDFSATGLMMSRTIRLHLKGESHEV